VAGHGRREDLAVDLSFWNVGIDGAWCVGLSLATWLVVAGIARLAPTDVTEPARLVLSADFDWRFTLGDPAGAESPSFEDATWRVVQVPHDWSIESPPDPRGTTGNGEGYFPAGTGWYRRAFMAPEAWKAGRVSVEFDGVYRNATVFLNGHALGTRPSGYSSVVYDLTSHLTFGTRNVMAVRVDNSAQPNSRWYTGSGIYRHVRLVVTGPVHVAHWGVFVTTPEVTAAFARVVVRTTIANQSGAAARVTVETSITGPDGTVVGVTRSVATVASGDEDVTHELRVSTPALWAPATPRLYTAVTRILRDGTLVDEVATPFGIRSIAWSAEKGFILNGTPTKITGGSVHHDNGPLGAAALDRAEARRVEILKAAGFNAVRTAHNVPSPAFLDACDRLGLLVLDEAFDVWRTSKVKHDMARAFDRTWRQDLDAMVLRDRNHPSVVMWGLGNEIQEVWTPDGAPLAKKLAAYVRSLDGTRPLTQAFAGATFGRSPDAAIAVVDIAGYNYNIAANYQKDHERVPTRVMMTTESLPGDVFQEWQLAHDLPYMIGEFVWSAIDYLGESGMGAWTFGTPERVAQAAQFVGFVKPALASLGADGKNPFPVTEEAEDPSADPMRNLIFVGRPYHAATCGDIDLIGFRKPQSYYRDILWNRGDRVYATVRLPEPDGMRVVPTVWSVQPTLPSWTWPGHEGQDLQVEVYAGTERARLLLNDTVVGEQVTGRDQRFKAHFTVPYAPGTLRAVGMTGGRAVAEDVLETAGPPVRLRLAADRGTIAADGQDLAFVVVEAIDADGRTQPTANDEVRFALDGPAVIAAVGNGDATSDAPYVGSTRRLFNGRALVIVRSKCTAGRIELRAETDGLQRESLAIMATTAGAQPNVLR
jgi:beta-galactosidase